MPWPIVVPSGTRSNTTPHANTHPDDHNKVAQALTDLASVIPATGCVVKFANGPYTATMTYDVGAALPVFPVAGIVAITAVARAGYGTAAIDLMLDIGTSGIANLESGAAFRTSAHPGFTGYNGARANPWTSPYIEIPASSWGNLGSVSMLAPVAAGGKPNCTVRVAKGAAGSNFYVDGYAWVTAFLPGATIPSTPITPT